MHCYEGSIASSHRSTRTTSGTTPSAQPAREVRELSPATRDVYRFEFVSNKAGYRVWPISGTAELGAVDRFDVPHCGLTWMMDFDGSFSRLPDTNIPEPKAAWAFLINADRGTIELVATNTAEYVSSTGRPVMLLRLAGPIVTQPCD